MGLLDDAELAAELGISGDGELEGFGFDDSGDGDALGAELDVPEADEKK
jgi:hypothetical protein